MRTIIKSCGNDLRIELSKELLQKAGFSVGDILEAKTSNGSILFSKQYSHRNLEDRASEFGGTLHLDGEYDWGEQVGREVW